MPTYKEVLLGSHMKVKVRKCNDTGGWECLSDADVDKVTNGTKVSIKARKCDETGGWIIVGKNRTNRKTTRASLSHEHNKRKIRLNVLIQLAKQVYEKTKENNSSYGSLETIFQESVIVYPWLKKENLRWHVRKLTKKEKLKKSSSYYSNPTQEPTQEPTFVKTNKLLEIDSDLDPMEEICVSTPPRKPEKPCDNVLITPTLASNKAMFPSHKTDKPVVEKNKGRPKGSTMEKKEKKSEQLKEAMNYVATRYGKEKEKVENKKLPRGTIQRLISEAKDKFNVSPEIKVKTIESRFRRKRLCVNHPGVQTPMADVESYIVDVAQQKSIMNQPLTSTDCLNLANSLISGTDKEEEILNFHKKRKHFKNIESGNEMETPLLGKGYYRGFLNRNRDKLFTTKAKKFAEVRSNWITYKNFKKMYKLVYSGMVKAGVAIELEEGEWQDINGQKCEEKDAHGLKVHHQLTHPEYVVHVDEVGNNTNQKDNGLVGGEKRLSNDRDSKQTGGAKVACSTKDARWTTLGFTSGTGQPIMCGIIFAAEFLTPEERLGIDIFANVEGESTDIDLNYGDGKRYPGGPKCLFRGKTIPCCVTQSPKGSITSEILVHFLKALDLLNIWERTETGPQPFLLLDGHNSRLELPFLEYVNKPETKWYVCLGLPNGTSLWQVGDSEQQNGSYKLFTYRRKEMLVDQRRRMGLKLIEIERYDVIPIVNYAWERSFKREETNKRAIAERGWNPLNRALLLHKEVMKTKKKTAVSPIEVSEESLGDETPRTTSSFSSTSTSPPTPSVVKNLDAKYLNVSSGFAGTCVVDILQYAIKKKAIEENLNKREQEGTSFEESVKDL